MEEERPLIFVKVSMCCLLNCGPSCQIVLLNQVLGFGWEVYLKK